MKCKASSRARWAFVPEMPNEFKDIRRSPCCGQGTASVGNFGCQESSAHGVGALEPDIRRNYTFLECKDALGNTSHARSPLEVANGTLQTNMGSWAERWGANTSAMALASITRVSVPWASNDLVGDRSSPARSFPGTESSYNRRQRPMIIISVGKETQSTPVLPREGILTILISPSLKLIQAICAATRLLEQAVSMVILGPRKSKNQDTRLLSKLVDVPVAAYCVGISKSLTMISL